jgi:hypothetical protein
MRNSGDITANIGYIAGSSMHVADLVEVLMRSREHLDKMSRSP